MKRLLLAGVLALAVALSARAEADTPDIHYPNWTAGWCPGGGTISAGVTSLPSINGFQGYCDGAPFDDGSFWHQVPQSQPFSSFGTYFQTFCRVGKGSLFTSAAPPGSCGGEA